MKLKGKKYLITQNKILKKLVKIIVKVKDEIRFGSIKQKHTNSSFVLFVVMLIIFLHLLVYIELLDKLFWFRIIIIVFSKTESFAI